MNDSQQNNKPSRPGRKGGVTKSSEREGQDAPQKPKARITRRPMPYEVATLSVERQVLTQEEFRARVSRKAFELYELRRGITEVDDWIAAERLVKIDLLSEERGAGSV